MTRRKKPRLTFITPMTPAVRRAARLVDEAVATFKAYVKDHADAMSKPTARECYETTKAYNNNLMDGVRVGQAGYCILKRFEASFEAWKRGASWATEERLSADAQAFADFVRRECHLLATVIPLRPSGGVSP